MSKVRIGIIGLGFMGSTHFRIYRSLPNAEIVALADVDPAKRKGDISSVNGNIGNDDNSIPLDLTGVTTYENGFDLINDPNVDVVDICVPTPYHKDYMVAALKAGASYTVVPANGTNVPVGLFVNNAAGNPFDNAPAVASNKIAIAQKMASVEVDIYADVEFKIGDKLYADANGYLTNVKGSDETVIGIVTKLPTTSDPFMGLEMCI